MVLDPGAVDGVEYLRKAGHAAGLEDAVRLGAAGRAVRGRPVAALRAACQRDGGTPARRAGRARAGDRPADRGQRGVRAAAAAGRRRTAAHVAVLRLGRRRRHGAAHVRVRHHGAGRRRPPRRAGRGPARTAALTCGRLPHLGVRQPTGSRALGPSGRAGQPQPRRTGHR